MPYNTSAIERIFRNTQKRRSVVEEVKELTRHPIDFTADKRCRGVFFQKSVLVKRKVVLAKVCSMREIILRMEALKFE